MPAPRPAAPFAALPVPVAFALTAGVGLTACAGPPPPAAADNRIGSMGTPATAITSAPAPAARPTAADARARYLGRWVGVEGMVLDVAAGPGDTVRIENQWDLDHKGSFDGSVTVEGLRWMREGVAVVAVPSDGDATGLKYLAGKTDCLTVKPGEGYCRR